MFYADLRAVAQEAWAQREAVQRSGLITLIGESTFPAGALPAPVAAVVRHGVGVLLEAALGGAPEAEFVHATDDGRVRVGVGFRPDHSGPPDRDGRLETSEGIGHPTGRQPERETEQERVTGVERESRTEAADRQVRALVAEVDRVRTARREEMRLAVEEYLNSRDPETYEEKQQVANTVSGLLMRFGFAIRYHGQDCYLSTAPVSKTATGRFVLVPHGSPTRLIQRTRLPSLVKQLGSVELSDVAPPLTPEPPTPGKSWADRERNNSAGRPAAKGK